jgi:hypothetical protein
MSEFVLMQPQMHHNSYEGHAVEGGCREEVHGVTDGWKSRKDLASDKPPPGLSLSKYGLTGTFVTQRADGGLLVGSDRGEFGGDLRWLSHGREQVVREGNVFAIVRRPWGLVLLQGRAYNARLDGTVSILERGRNGQWSARPHLELPAAPTALRLAPDGGMAIATKMGTLALGPSGAVERFECRAMRR